MKSIYHPIHLTGRLCKNPISKVYDNGTRKATVVLCIQEYHINKEGRKIIYTHLHRITAWGKTADLVGRMLHKGTLISLEGHSREVHLYIQDMGYKSYNEITMDEFEIHLEVQERRLVRA